MPNFATLLKGETARLARKEVRAQTQDLKRASAAQRSEIAALRKRVLALERELRSLARAGARAAKAGAEPGAPAAVQRFSAKGLASQRRRLALSALDCGLLLGTSGQTIYNWERGQARPQARHLPAIAALRRMGKREAGARLAALRAAPAGPAG